jgi:hypothetical protein
MTAADRQQQPRTPGTFRFSLRGLLLFTTAIAVVCAAGHYLGYAVYVAFGFPVVLIVPGIVIELLTRRPDGTASGSGWLLSGTIAIIHLSLFLTAAYFNQSLNVQLGIRYLDDSLQSTLGLVSQTVVLISMFPVGWFGLLFNPQPLNGFGIVIFIAFMAANSTVVGVAVTGFVQLVCRKTGWVTEPSTPDISPGCSACPNSGRVNSIGTETDTDMLH